LFEEVERPPQSLALRFVEHRWIHRNDPRPAVRSPCGARFCGLPVPKSTASDRGIMPIHPHHAAALFRCLCRLRHVRMCR
jgi:hypothetical protein